MGMVVQHNMNALSAYNKLNANVAGLKKSSEKLSSGYRINKAGDDAAGLAISEKMRSQIRGLNQAVRNSQDGINMIQTFEGAAQETHSILQRMKELASESANGTYDNATDRAAIQLEFDQLNDELNQIADTDFNGTIVLNGGEMADGLKQVDGNFDYKNKADQITAANQEALKALQAEAQGKIDVATTNLKLAENTLKNTKVDMSNNGAAVEFNTVDNSKYDKDAADNLWKDLGLLGGANGDSDATEVEITFEVKSIDNTTGEITWQIKSATSNASDKVTFTDDDLKDAASALTITDKSGDGTNVSGKGGFTYTTTTGANVVANAIVDTKNAKVGDTVTLKFTNAASEKYAPANIGMDKDSLKNTAGIADPTITLNADLKDDKMTEDVAAALTKLDTAKVVADYQTDGTVNVSLVDDQGIAVDGLTISENATTKGQYDITMADGTVLASVSGLKSRVDSLSTANAAIGTAATADGKFAINVGSADNGSYVVFDGTNWVGKKADGTDLTDVSVIAPTANGTAPANAMDYQFAVGDRIDFDGGIAIANVKFTAGAGLGTGRVEFGIATESFKYSEDGGVSVSAGKDKTIDSDAAVAAQKAVEKAKAELEAAQKAYPNELPKGVTKADAYDNSTARMTYTDNITLQTGARTKDAVNFTFQYNTDGTADMGDLKANLNLSAREDGLNTANLSLANQKDANYAIDQIDKAINKTSMVRATFGSIQNRLEHKITNLTTTSENLQEAESSIRDTDMASEMMNYTKFNILQQAAQSMLAQANQQPQSILQLLG